MEIIEKLNSIENNIYEHVLSLEESQYKNQDIGVLSGNSGYILLLSEKYLLTKDEKFLQRVIKIIETVSEQIIELPYVSSTFCNGIAGYLYLLSYLKERNVVNLNFRNYTIYLLDRIIKDVNDNSDKLQGYDFLHGRIGLGLALTKYLKYKKSKEGLIKIIDFIEKESECDKNGRKWYSRIRMDLNTYGYNLSLSHGQASIISFLSKLYQLEIDHERVKQMLNESIEFVINNKLNNKLSMFPPWIDELPLQESRLAWCYGDLGIGIALYNSAKILNNSELEEFAKNIFVHNTKRKNPLTEGVYDACLCHGCAGIALVYYRMYLNTNIELFHETYLHWCKMAIQMQREGQGVAGFQMFETKEKDVLYFKNDYSVLNGVSGIGLVFNSIVQHSIPDWDRFLLLS